MADAQSTGAGRGKSGGPLDTERDLGAVSSDAGAGPLQNRRVAVLATDGVEQVELVEPVCALEAAGARVDLVSLEAGEIQCFNHMDKGDRLPVDLTVDAAKVGDYDGLADFGPLTGQRTEILGVSQFLVQHGKIVRETRVFDEIAVRAQINAARGDQPVPFTNIY